MKQLLIILIASVTCLMSSAEVQFGTYEVPREDGAEVQFPSEIEFKGDSIQSSDEIQVLFPTQLVGLENYFVLKKKDGKWKGDDKLFDK
ncbi:MAG: hypothetical protein AAF203_01880, partial [Pseudomonadota bacterium]